MKFHREGRLTITVTILFVAIMNIGMYLIFPSFGIWNALIVALSIFLLYIILQFFRNPPRNTTSNPENIIAPADGKVVVIEEVEETEYFHDKRIQISIFMSPLNVHANFNPISGIIKYVKYHKGLFLVAWHPKSSTDNERSTVVTEHANGKEILFRQVAGAVARRICYYTQPNQKVTTGEEYGFIKFGSRIDLYLPLDSTINVKIGDIVKGRITKIGELK